MEILFYLDNVHVLEKKWKNFNHIWQQDFNCTGIEFTIVPLFYRFASFFSADILKTQETHFFTFP